MTPLGPTAACFVLLLSACSGGAADAGREVPHDTNSGAGNSTSSGAGGGDTNAAQAASVDGGIDIDDPVDDPAPPGCGDGVLGDDEVCDDGDRESGDGCADNCLALESGFSCATPGKACIVIARCGDGLIAPSEQCDDANTESDDGCSNRCRVEMGSKCDGAPSVCTPTTCGDGIPEGAEACDDGNQVPFDGCSALCLREPNCAGLSCTSDCGDGLMINEGCDDGNVVDGDGCSSTCSVETGFTCKQESTCEMVNGACILRVPVIYRDFSEAHPDFGNNGACDSLVLGAVADELDENGRPHVGGGQAATQACLSGDANFLQWYADSDLSETLVGDLILFDNGVDGYVNRFGPGGEQFVGVDPTTERSAGATEASCTTTCQQQAINGEAPLFDSPLRCDDRCRPLEQERTNLVSGERAQLDGDLNRAMDADPPDEELIAEIEAEIEAVEAEIAALDAAIVTCEDDCTAELGERTATCVATCKGCSYDPDQWCIGAESVTYDGTPLFFPVDSITGPTANSERATIPSAYGYSGLYEDVVFPEATPHNFYFTSEVQYWLRYDMNTNATLDFLGDDDVWVFLNGKLAVDLGGVHLPASGSVTIDGAAGTVTSNVSDGEMGGVRGMSNDRAEDFGLAAGNVYKISVFQAERKLSGSSYKLTLSGFEATPSDCSAVCGDGILSFGEECDDKVNDGGYGECAPECKLGPFCGDGMVQAPEQCDNGPGGGAGCPNCRDIAVK